MKNWEIVAKQLMPQTAEKAHFMEAKIKLRLRPPTQTSKHEY